MEQAQTANIQGKLSDLVDRFKKAFGDRLVSVILFGSAAAEDWNQENSDLNVLAVLDRLSTGELSAAEAIARWWREAGNPPPLLLTDEEVRTSTDCFPMEFYDMQHHRRILFGADLIKDLTVDAKYYRAQVEHELRAKQLRLRQRGAEVLSEPARLQRLMIDSISTFCVLGRHALILSGNTPFWTKREIVAALASATGKPLGAFNEILTIRSSGKRVAAESISLFERYLAEVAALVHFVDALAY